MWIRGRNWKFSNKNINYERKLLFKVKNANFGWKNAGLGLQKSIFDSKSDLLNANIFCDVKKKFLGTQSKFWVLKLKKKSILGLKTGIWGVLQNKDFHVGQEMQMFIEGAGNAVWRHKEDDLGLKNAIFG